MFSIPGVESLPLAVQFAVLFVVIFAVFALIILVLRRLMGGRVAMQSADRERTRTRQPRLGIVDVYDLDRQRQLVLLRRDNVEHLLLIGGPNDVVIETNIVRSSAARPNPAVDNGDRSDNDRPVEAPVSRPVLETSSWAAPSAPMAQIGPAEAAGAMPAVVSLPQAAAARPAGAESQGGLQKTLSQYLRRPETAARPPEASPAARASAPADKPSRPVSEPKPSLMARPTAAAPAPSPAPVSQAEPTEAKLPFGMRAPARPIPPPPAAAPIAPSPSPPPPPTPPTRSAPAPAPPSSREPAPPASPPTETAPPGDISGDLRPAEPNLVDTALLSDMAKQLETALRRPLSQAAPQAAFEADPIAPASPPPPSALPTQQGASGQQNLARSAPAPNRPAPPAGSVAPRPQPGAGDGARPVTPPARNPATFAPPPPAKPVDDEENNDFSRPLGHDRPPNPADNRSADHDRLPAAPVQTYSERPGRETAPVDAIVEEESLHFEAALPPEPAPAAAAHEPAPAPSKASQVDPFSMEDIEAEFARLLGRPLDKR